MTQKHYEVIDNFLDKETFENIKEKMFSKDFPWFFIDGVTSRSNEQFYFFHLFYDKYKVNSQLNHIVMPIVDKIKPQAIIRIKGNLYPNVNKKVEHDNHTDYDYAHQGAIFYLNENNGPTVLHDGTEIYPKENRILFFDSSKQHHSVTCTDQMVRMNINFNYFKVN